MARLEQDVLCDHVHLLLRGERTGLKSRCWMVVRRWLFTVVRVAAVALVDRNQPEEPMLVWRECLVATASA